MNMYMPFSLGFFYSRPTKIILCLLLNLLLVSTAFAEESIPQHCVQLNKVDLDNNDILDEEQQQKLLKPYMGKCIDGKLLKAIIADVSSFYMTRGHITTRPYLKKQEVFDGQIDISILTGTVEDIVDASTKESNARIKTAFAFQKGHVLNLRDLETALEMMNRPPSSEVKFELKPGDKPGASIVEIKSKDALPYHLKTGVSGRKNLSDKNFYLTAEFSIDNLFNINDILKVSYNGSRVQKEYQGTKGGEINYSFPVASYLVELVGSSFSYRQGVNGLNDTYLSNGDTSGLRLRVNKVLMRDQKNKLNMALSVYHKSTKNYFANQLIDVSSYKTTLAQMDLMHTWLQDWGRLTTVYSYYQGTDWFGARADGYVSAEIDATTQAKLQFKKHSIDVGLLYYLGDRSYQFASNFHLQYTTDTLYDVDKLTVGSDYTVRGYLNRNLYGNNAWYSKNDITKTWILNVYPPLLESISASVGFDYGQARCETDNRSSCGNIYGMAVGLSTQSQKLTTSFVWSRPLKKINNNFKLNDLFKFDVTWQF